MVFETKGTGSTICAILSISLTAVFERLRNILHSGEIDRRVEYMIEVMFAIRKDGFKVSEQLITKYIELLTDSNRV